MNSDHKAIIITIFLLCLSLIVIVLQNADAIDGQDKLREVFRNGARC